MHTLDQLIALTNSSTSRIQTGSIEFQKHIQNLQDMKAIYEEADKQEDEEDFLDDLATWTALGEDDGGETLRNKT